MLSEGSAAVRCFVFFCFLRAEISARIPHRRNRQQAKIEKTMESNLQQHERQHTEKHGF